MIRSIPLGAFVPPLVILSAVCFGGCASPGVSRRASVLALPYLKFEGSGDRRDYCNYEWRLKRCSIETQGKSLLDNLQGMAEK